VTVPAGAVQYVRKHNRWWPLAPTEVLPPPGGPGSGALATVEVDVAFITHADDLGGAPAATTHDLGPKYQKWHDLAQGINFARIKLRADSALSDLPSGTTIVLGYLDDADAFQTMDGAGGPSLVIDAAALATNNGVLKSDGVPLTDDAKADRRLAWRILGGNGADGITIDQLSAGLLASNPGPDDEGPPPPACEIFNIDPNDFLADAVENDTQDIMAVSIAAHPDGGLDSVLMDHHDAATATAPAYYIYGWTYTFPGLVPGDSYYIAFEAYWDDNGTPLAINIPANTRTPFVIGPVTADADGDGTFSLEFQGEGAGGPAVPSALIYLDQFSVISAPCAVDPTPGGGGGGPGGGEVVPPPTPVVGDNPFGMASLPAGGGGVFNSTIRPIRLSDVEDQLDVASGAGMKLFVLPGGPQGVHNPGGQFNLNAYLNNIDAMANDSAANSAIEDAIADGTIFAMYLLDEPTLVSRYGRVVSVAELTTIAQAVNDAWPGVRMVIRARPSAQASMITATGPTNAVGYWLAYAARKGSVTSMLAQDVTASAGRLLVVGMNVIDFHNLSGGSASATDLITYGTPLAQHAYPSAFSCWEYRASYYNGPGIAQAFEDLGNIFQAAHP
jgi:hypothetical protein